MNASLLLPAAMLCTAALAPAQIPQPTHEYINPATGHVYTLLEASSWTNADLGAVAIGGNLVTINDGAEDLWVYNTFNFITGGNIWIGLNDVATEGNWVWTSGETVTYTNWYSGEPNDLNNNEDYGHIWGWYFGQWNDFNDLPNGWGDFYGVVEWDPNPNGMYLLQPDTPLAGFPMTLEVGGLAGLSGRVYFAGSLQGGTFTVPNCSGMTLGLSNPTLIGTAPINAMGYAGMTIWIPPSLMNTSAHIQAVALTTSTCYQSNLIDITIN